MDINKKFKNEISTKNQKIKKDKKKLEIIIQDKIKELLSDKKYLYSYKI